MLAPILTVLLLGAWQPAPGSDVIVEIRVHGNLATSEDEILGLAGVRTGEAFEADTVELVAQRLRAARRFERVEVLKRFASISDPSQILLVILVDDGPVTMDWSGEGGPRVRRRTAPTLMFLPILYFQDGYGFTYGGRVAVPDPAGARSRLSFPLTWGGRKGAAVALEKLPGGGPLSRVEVEGFVSSSNHPFFDRDDTRKGVRVTGERSVGAALRLTARAGLEDVSFGDVDERFAHVGGAVVLDTRLDPASARDALYARAAITHLGLPDRAPVNQLELDGRGYLGLFGQQVLVLKVQRVDADRPSPAYVRPILGGADTVRGLAAGAAVGDTLMTASAEVRVPLTSPLSFGQAGISGFVDIGTAYDKGERLSDQRFERGVGGAWWFSAAVVRTSLAVAYGIGRGTRLHFTTTLAF